MHDKFVKCTWSRTAVLLPTFLVKVWPIKLLLRLKHVSPHGYFNGRVLKNFTPHMSLKLDRTQRWLKVRNHLAYHDGLAVNFSSTHHDYYSAWKYVTKIDQAYLQSQGHPYLTTSFAPLTNDASKAVVQATHTWVNSGAVNEGEPSENTGRGWKRAHRLIAYDVSQNGRRKGLSHSPAIAGVCRVAETRMEYWSSPLYCQQRQASRRRGDKGEHNPPSPKEKSTVS